WPLAARARLLRLNVVARTGGHQSFAHVAADPTWAAALEEARNGKRALIATNTGGHFALAAIDCLLAMALTLRGARVSNVLCDAALPACQMCEFNLMPDITDRGRNQPDALLCGYCHAPAEQRLRKLRLDIDRLGAQLTPQ